jgi:hypothetical protein
MASTKHRAVKWLAPVALVGVVGLAACGDDDADSARTAGVDAAAVGSDRHLENQAAEAAVNARVADAAGSDRHLENQAAEAVNARVAEAAGSDRHLENQAAEAEASVGEADVSTADAGPNVWEAGNRAAAEYEASQRQTEPADTEDEFVPGSRHMPLR